MNKTFFQSTLKISILFAVFFSIFSTTNAAGVLDKTFGTNGTVTTPIGANLQITATKTQTDGKMLALGIVGNGGGQDTVLVRHNQNGSLDVGFGNKGIVVSAFSPFYETANDLTLQSDGKIVITGNVYSPITQSVDFLVARFNQNGTLDTSFGTNGIVTVNQGSNDVFNSVAIQLDGKIVAVGRTSDRDRAAVIRFNANGTLDGSFANGGLFYWKYDNIIRNTVFLAVKLYQNGRILLGGGDTSADTANGHDIFMLLEPNGTLAQDFGTNLGFFREGINYQTQNMEIAVLPDGKFLAISDLSFRRYFSNGADDQSFRSLASYSSSITSVGTDFAIRSDGKIIVLNQGTPLNPVLTTVIYNNNGREINRAGSLFGADIIVQNDDKFVVFNSTGNSFTLTRYVSISSPGTRIADFDYDNKTDLAVSRFDETMYVLRSLQSVTSFRLNRNAGESIRVIPEEFDINEISQFRLLYWRASSQNASAFFDSVTESGNYTSFQWGISSDKPVGGDYDGEIIFYNSLYRRSTELAIFRPSTGTWWIQRSSDGGSSAIRFGIASDIPLTGDFDGDGKADLTVYRASEGNWYQLLTTEGFRVVRFGISTDSPVPGDYDGDGRHDIAVFRDGVWYISQSTDGLKVVQWGISGDSPVSVRYDQ